MQNSADSASSGSRPVIIYIIVAVVLFAALVLGVRWAKNRAGYYAQHQTGSSQTASNSQSQTGNPSQGGGANSGATSTPQPASSGSSNTSGNQTTPAPSPSVASTTPAEPSHVPSTGPEQVFLTLGSLLILAFAATSYVRARRRLQQLAH